MSNREATLTAANIRYLLALHELDSGDKGAHSSDIAGRLGVTKPSVHTMIKKFCEKGYVTKEKYGTVHLTALGKQLAERYAKQYALLYGKMEHSLELPPEDCRTAVCAVLEQISSKELMEAEKQEV